MHIDCRCDMGRCLVIEALCNTPGEAAAMHMALCPGRAAPPPEARWLWPQSGSTPHGKAPAVQNV